MKTLMVEDDLYEALEGEAHKVGCTVGELVSEVVSAWLADAELDERERVEIEAARVEAAIMGGVEADEFFDQELPEAPVGRDRDKIRLLGDIIEPIDVEWEAESNPGWSGSLDRLNARE